jgi:hypothetical protein
MKKDVQSFFVLFFWQCHKVGRRSDENQGGVERRTNLGSFCSSDIGFTTEVGCQAQYLWELLKPKVKLVADILISFLDPLSLHSTTQPRPGIFLCVTFLAGRGQPIPPVPSAPRYGITQHSLTFASVSPFVFGITSLIGLP